MKLQAQNRIELEEMIKRSITLNDDETVKITVIKEPKKILFFNIKGTYEVEIIKKSDEKVKEFHKKEQKIENKTYEYKEKKSFEKKEKNFENKKENTKEYEHKTPKFEKKEEKVETDSNKNTNYNKIRGFIKEFIVKTKLDITILDIKKVGDRYIVNLDGKDMRYLIGEKGSTLNSLEYLLTSVKTFKNIKVVIDSNNYKESREKVLRNLARKQGKKVQETGRSIKLNPMSARERKIIHEEISYMKGLKTESQGEEPKRFLVIKPE